jgi:uncharacterized protein YhaN
MRLAKLELLAYGPFKGASLDFSAPGVHVVLGRNEAGKSTTLRAITGLLYGIDSRTPDAHVHKFADLRIGGVLENAEGKRIRVIRRKGNANTLLDEREQVLDEAVMKRLLGGVGKETFLHAFGLDHGMLEAGARALLEGKGDLGESLFDASTGGGGEVQRLLAELEAEADRLYKPRGSALPLNEALKAFAEAQKVVREKESRPEAFLEQERGLEEAIKDRDARVAKKKDLETRRARIARARRRAPLERRRERALERRAELGAVAAQVARVEALRSRHGIHERTVEQRRVLLAEVEHLAARVAEAARSAGVDPGASTEALRLDARKDARVHSLLSDRAMLAERLEAAGTEIVRLERDLARLSERARGLADERAPATPMLASALERARALGDVEARLAAGRTRLERRANDLEAKVAALGLFEGTLDAFVALRLPAIPSVERLQTTSLEIERTSTRLAERIVELEREAASLEKQIAASSGDFAPPDAASLAAARAARDEAWRTVREATDAALRRSAEIAMEGLLRDADVLADRMIREADRVTTLARLRSEADTNARQHEKVLDEKSRAAEQRADLDRELAALFADARIAPRGFAEMCQWLDHHRRISEDHVTLREAQADLGEEEQKVSAVKADLATALGEAADRRLVELVAIAGQRIAEMDALRREADDAASRLVEVRTKLDERAAVRSRDEAALADVNVKLDELLAPLGIPADASAEEVTRSLQALRDLFGVVDDRQSAEARARLADADVRTFEADLSRAITELAPDLASMELRDGALALFARGTAATELARELADLEARLESEGDVTLDDADRALLADVDAAEAAEQELTEHIDELDDEARQLTERIGGIRSGLEKMRAESHAAEAAAAAQLQLSRVRENAERWARVKLASILLSREIERYREENQGPLLGASSAFFARLTLGSFSGIKAGFDDKDRPCLRCVRADGGAEVDVTGLSDGTRDQLYLSLRLASLLRRAELTEPMPLVLDDVLIQLDDQRAAAALAVLSEVSHKMQVLFFTHHARLVELARASIAESGLVIHELVSGPYAREAIASIAG